jgi:hypothetical protein
MDDKTGTRKKPSAISARPAVRPVGSRGAPASAAAPHSQGVAPMGQAKGELQPRAENMQVIEGGGAKTGPNVKTYIEQQLKSVYDDILNQPIPDRFLDLLNALDGPEATGAQNAGSPGAKSEEHE